MSARAVLRYDTSIANLGGDFEVLSARQCPSRKISKVIIEI